jgi:hypothetical protein
MEATNSTFHSSNDAPAAISSRPRFNNYSKRDVGIPDKPFPLPGRKSSAYDHIQSRYAAQKIDNKRPNSATEFVEPSYMSMSTVDQDRVKEERRAYLKTLSQDELKNLAEKLEKRIINDQKDLKLINTIMIDNQQSKSDEDTRV